MLLMERCLQVFVVCPTTWWWGSRQLGETRKKLVMANVEFDYKQNIFGAGLLAGQQFAGKRIYVGCARVQ